MADSRQVAKKTPARKAAKATPAKQAAASKTPAKKTAARKVATGAATSTRSAGTARTAAAPAAVVEEQAVTAAQPRQRPRPDPNRPAAVAARALRGEPDPGPAPAAEPGEEDPSAFAAAVDARLEELRAQARAEVEAEMQAAGAAPQQGDPDYTAEVPFRDRVLIVKMPSEEQLTMYRRVSREFVALGKSGRANRMPIDEALKHLDRAVRTVQSVLANDDDREWIEDLLMDGQLKIVECTDLMKAAFRMLAEKHGNRQERRAAAAMLED